MSRVRAPSFAPNLYLVVNVSESDDFVAPSKPVIPQEILDDETVALLSDLHSERLAQATNIETYQLPELPESDADNIYERIKDAERLLASPNLSRKDYRAGTAVYKDEIAYFHGYSGVLLTAEHATTHFRRETEGGRIKLKGPDRGTAGLGYVLHTDTDATFMAMRGRQTSDANHAENHPLKNAISFNIASRGIKTFLSIHGMSSGKFTDFIDERAYDVLIGIGSNPSEQSVLQAEHIRDIAGSLGLRAAINEWFVSVAEDEPLTVERDEHGRVVYKSYSAPHYTTRATAQKAAELVSSPLAAVQIELSDLLRLMPREIKRDFKTRKMGVYLGYLLLKQSLTE